MTNRPLYLGCGADCTAISHLDGDLDAVRIWSEALSVEEINLQTGN